MVGQVMRERFGILYLSYTENCYYFEFIDLYRRVVLTSVILVFSDDPTFQLFLAILVSVVWLAILMYMKPYKLTWDNNTAILFACHLIMILIIGMTLKLYDSDDIHFKDQISSFHHILFFTSGLACFVL